MFGFYHTFNYHCNKTHHFFILKDISYLIVKGNKRSPCGAIVRETKAVHLDNVIFML